MTIDKNVILSGAMNASNISSITNVFYIDRNFGKYQKQTLINKGDLVEVDTEFLECKLEEHNIDIQHYKSTIDVTHIASDLLRSHIHSHVVNYLTSNANVSEYIKFYKQGFFKKLFTKKAKTKEEIISSIESNLKQDSVVLFSIHSFNDILTKSAKLTGVKDMCFIEAGFIKNNKCYVLPTWSEKSVLIVNKNDLDVVINRKIKVEEKDDIMSIIIGLGIFKSQKSITRINLI